MKISKSIFLILGTSFILILEGCLSHKPLPKAVYAKNYSALTTNEQRAILPVGKDLSKQEAVNIAIANNPDYQISQLKAVSAQTKYYEALAGLSPTVAAGAVTTGQGINAAGVSANYRVFNGGRTVMNILEAKAKAEQSKWNVQNTRRKLIKEVTVQNNSLYKDSAILKIQQSNSRFQSDMAKKTIQKYNQGQASETDVLNFQIKEYEAKAAAIAAYRDYNVNSYKLAASMGMTTAKLPAQADISKSPIIPAEEDKKQPLPEIDFYLDAAIANRPDLKAQRDALKAAGYASYSAMGKLAPIIDLGLGRDGFQTRLYWLFLDGGARIANVRSKEALYGIQQEALLEKWIKVVQNVRTEYDSLKANKTRVKLLNQAVKIAFQRRNMVLREYNEGKIDITTLNQAQKDLVNAKLSNKEAEVAISNAKAKLNAACGIQNN